MIRFSTDPEIAERQMQAIIFYLTTFGYIDGDFDSSEKDYVRSYIAKLVAERVRGGMPDAAPELLAELEARFTTHFHEVFESIDTQVRELFHEAVAGDEDQDTFIHSKLKLRCFELFQGFERENQEGLLDAMDALIEADGEVHPAERKFKNELVALFEQDLGVEMVDDNEVDPAVEITAPTALPEVRGSHPFFDQFEYHYSSDPDRILQQVQADRELIDRAIEVLEAQRKKGDGKLYGRKTVQELASEGPFLDGHVWIHPTVPGETYELTVLGDLHGCYSVLKGAVMQSHFFDKVSAYRLDPKANPKPLLILLGDYIDRGLFSLNGVLRTVMQIFVTAPEHVYVLRGNHEYYVEYKGEMYGGVKPAESINTLKPLLPLDVFRHYRALFEALPNVLLFDQVMFVHAGIPRDKLIKERWKDLASLNDPDMRFQMMWSDPSSADVIPAALQEQSARFPFGRLQASAFLRRMGCHSLVRGHEKVNSGFVTNYKDDQISVMTLFSSGGADNADLPEGSSYRTVTPKALTVTWKNGALQFIPWDVDYRTYNDPAYNAFFKTAPEIEQRS